MTLSDARKLASLCASLVLSSVSGVKVRFDANTTRFDANTTRGADFTWYTAENYASPFLNFRVQGGLPGNPTLPLVYFYVDKEKVKVPGSKKKAQLGDFDSYWESHFRYNLGALLLGAEKVKGTHFSNQDRNMMSNGLPLLRSFGTFAEKKQYDGTIILTSHSGTTKHYTPARSVTAGLAEEVGHVGPKELFEYYLKPALDNTGTRLQRVIFLTCSAGVRTRELKADGQPYVPWNEDRHILGTSLVDKVLKHVKEYVDAGGNGGIVPRIYGANGYVYTGKAGETFQFTVHTRYESKGRVLNKKGKRVLKSLKPYCDEEKAKPNFKNGKSLKDKDPEKCDMALAQPLSLSYAVVERALDETAETAVNLEFTGQDYNLFSLGSNRKHWKDGGKMHAFLEAALANPKPEEEQPQVSKDDEEGSQEDYESAESEDEDA